MRSALPETSASRRSPLHEDPPGAVALGALIDKLEDPVTDLVRRDNEFKQLGLREEDVATRAPRLRSR